MAEPQSGPPAGNKRVTIIPRIHGKITKDGKISEPDIQWMRGMIVTRLFPAGGPDCGSAIGVPLPRILQETVAGRKNAPLADLTKLTFPKPFPKSSGPTVVGPPSWSQTARFSFAVCLGILLEKRRDRWRKAFRQPTMQEVAAMREVKRCLWSLAVFWAATVPAMSQDQPSTSPPGQGLFRHHLADYNSELRLRNGRVDTDATVKRLKELGVTTYYGSSGTRSRIRTTCGCFCPRHPKRASKCGSTWCRHPKARRRTVTGIPNHSASNSFTRPVQGFRSRHPNLTAWVIDDFYDNHKFFTPQYLPRVRAESKGVNPRLAFLPLMYFGGVRPKFVNDYRGVIDGVRGLSARSRGD